MKRSTIWIDGTEYRKEHIEDGRVVYACDRRACLQCKHGCSYTTDVSHAKNFHKRGQIFVDG